MTEEQFWKCTPKKLDEMFKIHKQINGIEDKEDNMEYIDNVLF